MSFGRGVAICGVGESEYSRCSNRTPLALAIEAVQTALRDGGLQAQDLDGIVCYAENDSVEPEDVASALGIRVDFTLNLHSGGGSAESLVAMAGAAIMAGLTDTVACFRAMNGRTGLRVGREFAAMGLPHLEFLVPYGITAAQAVALVAGRHMHNHGTTKEQLGHVALTFREHANRNPRAIMYGKRLEMDGYLNAPMISSPFGLFDCSLEADGASCLIVSRMEHARDCRKPPVRVAGAAARVTKHNPGNIFTADGFTEAAGKFVAPRIFGMAGIGPNDVDVASFYDCFTFAVISQVEAYGFVKTGEGGPFVESGNLRMEGDLPSNTAGGMLSEAYVHGLNNVVEVVRQLRHDYDGTERQVAGAEVGLCSGFGGPAVASGLILVREA